MLIKCLKILFISMLPIIELRGAIPFAVAWEIPLYIAFPAAIIGNMIPVPFILLLFNKAKMWFKNVPLIGKIFAWADKKGTEKATGIKKMDFLALIGFVAVPIPGTGAWIGSVIATVLGMKPKKSIPSIMIGVLIAGIIVAFVSYGAGALFFNL